MVTSICQVTHSSTWGGSKHLFDVELSRQMSLDEMETMETIGPDTHLVQSTFRCDV